GGGIFCDYSSPTITNNTISNNSVNTYGGGIYCSSSSTIITNNTISNNSAYYDGGGIYCYSSSPTITSNTISNNSAGWGGGIYCDGSSPAITNNTISNNDANNGGALYCTANSNPTLRNSILYGNTTSTSGSQVYLNDENSDPNFYYCNVQGGTAAFGLNGVFYTGAYENNIDVAPLFVAPSAGSGTGYDGVTADWSLQSGSSCINAGDPNGTYPATDKAGNPRIIMCRIDMGAYEYQYAIPITFTTSQTNVSCYGGSDGTAVVSVTGGTPPYTYEWNTTPAQTNDTATGLSAGTYFATVTDANGCIDTVSITITELPAIAIDSVIYTNLTCNNQCSGTISITASGGTGVLQYSINNGSSYQFSNTFSSLCASTYNIMIKDANNCTQSGDTVTITQPLALNIVLDSTDASCSTCSDGTATVIASGGTPQYTYLWNDSDTQTTATATELLPGVYTVVLTDSNLCCINDSIEVSYSTSINEAQNTFLMNIYPNPANVQIIVESRQKSEDVVISIYDVQRREVEIPHFVRNDKGQVMIDISALPSGVYIVKVSDEKDVIVKKLVIQ
ncbi:MAG: T9SS type A sorting domain-containing protein, partial [Bacteroidia bacterium]|nr:T9SS type A sorting domain-containing protein [Bacteroidia bacterium]